MTVSATLLDLSASNQYSLDDVNKWDERLLNRWISDIGMPQYCRNFAVLYMMRKVEHNIDGRTLLELNNRTLLEMGIKSVGDRMRFVILIRRLKAYTEEGRPLTRNSSQESLQDSQQQELKRETKQSKSTNSSKDSLLRISTQLPSNVVLPVTTPTSSQSAKIKPSWATAKMDSAPVVLRQAQTSALSPMPMTQAPASATQLSRTAGGSSGRSPASARKMSPSKSQQNLSPQQSPSPPTTRPVVSPYTAELITAVNHPQQQQKPKRIVKVVHGDVTTMVDVTACDSMSKFYSVVLHRMAVMKQGVLVAGDRELAKWSFVKRSSNGVAQVLGEQAIIQLCSTRGSGGDVPVVYLTRRNPALVQQQRKNHTVKEMTSRQRSNTKLEKLLGESPSRWAGNSSQSEIGTTSSQQRTQPLQAGGSAQTLTRSRSGRVINEAASAKKLRKIFGQRPPSELIATNLVKYFPNVISPTATEAGTGEKTDVPATVAETPETLEETDENDFTEVTKVDAGELEQIRSLSKSNTSASNTEVTSVQASSLASRVLSGGTKRVKWVRGTLLGTGSFGNVYLGLIPASGELMAVKQVIMPADMRKTPVQQPINSDTDKLQQRRRQMVEALQREIVLLKDLDHPNIVRYRGSESTDMYLNIFLEYVAGGSLSTVIQSSGAIADLQRVKQYTRQVLDGLAYLHSKNIVHRDIKSANILVDDRNTAKISDFGISKKIAPPAGTDGKDRAYVISLYQHTTNRTSSLQGSVYWLAPEVVKYFHYTKKSDIWSLGCLVIKMLTGQHPWAGMNQMAAMFKIGQKNAPSYESHFSAESVAFLDKCLALEYKDRPHASVLLTDTYLQIEL